MAYRVWREFVFCIFPSIPHTLYSIRLQKFLEEVRIEGVLVRALRSDFTARDELGKTTVHIYHPLGRAGLDDGVYLVGALLADEVGDRFVVDEELIARDAPARDARNEPLGENAREACRELQADLFLLPRREGINDAVNGLRGVVGMQSG